MLIENNLQSVNPEIKSIGPNKKREPSKSVELPINDTRNEAPEKKDNTAHFISKPDLKEAAREMLAKDRQMGTFKDKDRFGEATDLQIGPDIRYALTSKNPDFLRRIIWGPLTSAEYREVYHRLNELESKGVNSNNMLKGQIIDLES